jgi:hypothetical protein
MNMNIYANIFKFIYEHGIREIIQAKNITIAAIQVQV